MQPRTKKIINIIATAVPVALAALSGFMKLSGAEQIKEGMAKVGVGPYVPVLGIMEITFAVLFIFPKTMRIGFILLSCYFAGAMATELSHNGPIANAMIPLVLVWIGTFVRDKSVFMLQAPKRNSALDI